MFYHQKVAKVRVLADIQNFALRAHCVHGIPLDYAVDCFAHHPLPLGPSLQWWPLT